MLQYVYLSLTIAVALPLTLPIDGTDWAAQFGGWSGGDWAWLVCGGTVVYGEPQGLPRACQARLVDLEG